MQTVRLPSSSTTGPAGHLDWTSPLTAILHVAAAEAAKRIQCALPATPAAAGLVAEVALGMLRDMTNAVSPTGCVYISIDGVAPRAKMNQQRSRRYASGTEWAAYMAGMPAEAGQPARKHSANLPLYESNGLTPGTAFMAALQTALAEGLASRGDHAEPWCQVDVVLSTTASSGEGEHKIMAVLRAVAASPGATQLRAAVEEVFVGEAPLVFTGTAAWRDALVLPLRVTVFGNDADWLPLLLGLSNQWHKQAAHEQASDPTSDPLPCVHPADVPILCSILRPASRATQRRKEAATPARGRNGRSRGRKHRLRKEQRAARAAQECHAIQTDGAPPGEGADTEFVTEPGASDSALASGAAPSSGAATAPGHEQPVTFEVVDVQALWVALSTMLLSRGTALAAALQDAGESSPTPAWLTGAQLGAARRLFSVGDTSVPVHPMLYWLLTAAVDDFIALLTLVGNDFLPPLPGLSMRKTVRSALSGHKGLGLDALIEGLWTGVLIPALSSLCGGEPWPHHPSGFPITLLNTQHLPETTMRLPCRAAATGQERAVAFLLHGLSVGCLVRVCASQAVLRAEHAALTSALDALHTALAKEAPGVPEDGPAAPEVPVGSGEGEAPFDPYDIAAAVFGDDTDEDRAPPEADAQSLGSTQSSQTDDLAVAAAALADIGDAGRVLHVAQQPHGVDPHTGAGNITWEAARAEHYFSKLGWMTENSATLEWGALAAVVSQPTRDSYPTAPELLHITQGFLRGLAFVMQYYFRGVPDWAWFYPHHYAPFASDLAALSLVASLAPSAPSSEAVQPFVLGAPVDPLTQLISVLPPASYHILPAWVQRAVLGKEVRQQVPTGKLSGEPLASTDVVWEPLSSEGAVGKEGAEAALKELDLGQWVVPMNSVVCDDEEAAKDWEAVLRIPFIPPSIVAAVDAVVHS